MSSENILFPKIGDDFSSERSKVGYRFVPVSLEGPNGVGKTSIYKATLSIHQASHAFLAPSNSKASPVIGVAEPPDIKIDDGRLDSWRMLAKSGISKDGAFKAGELRDPLIQAGLFFWGRRLVEEKLFNRFPTRTSFYRDDKKFLNCFEIPQPFYKDGRQAVESLDDLLESGMATLIKDRGSGSTCVYQGSSENKGNEVMRLMTHLYETGFLIKEELTLVVVPYDYSSFYNSLDKRRDESEPDIHNNLNELERYYDLKFKSDIFSKRLIYIKNDSTGKTAPLFFPAMVSSILISAVEKGLLGSIKPFDGESVVEMEYPVLDIINFVESRLESDKPTFRDFMFETMWGSYKKGKYLITCGEFGLTEIDIVNNKIKFEIKPLLDEMPDLKS